MEKRKIKKVLKGRISAGLLYYPCTLALGTMAHARVAYCFTYNNYVEEKVVELKEWLTENCKYACLQKEVAPTTQTPHIQGYMALKKKQRMVSLQKKFGPLGITLALINANGTPEQNRTYCSKEGGFEFWETGSINIVGQGARTELEEPIRKIKEKRPLNEIANEHSEAWVRQIYYK